MAGGNLSPRQKMIGMMYLVLTALLALNVQKEVLDAFVIVNDGIETTTVNFAKKNNFTYEAFKFQLAQNQVKVKPYYDKALEVKKLSADLVTFLQGLKSELYVEADKIKKETADTFHLKYLQSKDNQEIPSHFMVGSGDGKNGKAPELKAKIEEYKKKVSALLKGMKDADKVALGMSTSNPSGSLKNGKLTWETDNFEHRPLAAVITILSKYQSDVRNAESNVLDYLYSQIDATSYKVDSFNAMAVASSEVVMQGMDYKADIFLGASSKTQDPQILVGGSPIKIEDGVGKYVAKAGQPGIVKWGGVINVKGPDGTIKPYPFEKQYIVQKPSTVISPTKMNVLYIGIPNPVAVSVPGIASERINVTISQGIMKREPNSKDDYLVEVKQQGEAIISVVAEIEDGKKIPMGAMKFRVKRIPDPIAKVGGKVSGNMLRADLVAQLGVSAILENFEFDLTFKVINFTITRSGKGRDPVTFESASNMITNEMKDQIRNCRIGDKIYFENIKAKGPDGSVRPLPPLSFTMQ